MFINVSYKNAGPAATSKWFATQHAAQLDSENASLYSPKKKAKGEELLAHVRSVFKESRVYLNYRKKFIAVKVERASNRALTSNEFLLLNAYCSANGITIKVTKTAHIFRIAR